MTANSQADISARASAASDIWIRRLDDRVVTKLTVEGGDNRFPAWTGDSKSLRYSSGANGFVILEKPADGSAPARVVAKANTAVDVIATSPDPQSVVYTTGSFTTARLYAAHIGDSLPTELLPGSHARSPALSPDGKWLAFSSVSNATTEVFVVPFPNVNSAKWQVSRQGGADPVWSNRGDELIYRDPNRFLVSVPVSTRPTFSTGAPKRLFSMAPYLPRYAISHDDQRFLMVHGLGAARSKLTVFENWPQALRAGAK
jgi:Tol biopolymer transport system component